MPDETTSDTETLPDFNLLRKPISSLAETLDKLTVTATAAVKSLSRIVDIDVSKLKQDPGSDSREPAIATSEYPRVEKPLNTTSPIASSISTQTSETPPVSKESPQVNQSSEPVKVEKTSQPTLINPTPGATDQTPGETSEPTKKPPTFLTKTMDRIRDTFKNVTNQKTTNNNTFLQKTMTRVSESMQSVKERLKEQPKINKLLENSSTILGGIKDKLKDNPTLNKLIESSTNTLSNIKDNLKEQPKQIKDSVIKFGKEGLAEQKEMDTPIMKIFRGAKELGKGNIMGAIKQAGEATSSYSEVKQKDSKSEHDQAKNKTSNISESQPAQTTTSNNDTVSTNTQNNVNITGLDNFSSKLEENTSKLNEWNKTISQILKKTSNSQTKITDIVSESSKTNTSREDVSSTDSKPGNVTSILSTPPSDTNILNPSIPDSTTQTTNKPGLRREEKPQQVEITNIDELATAIGELNQESKTSSKISGLTNSGPTPPPGDDSGGGIMSILGSALGLGKRALSKVGGLVKSGAKGALNLGKKAFGAGKSLLGKGVNMAKNLGGKAGKFVSGGVSKVKNLAGGAAKKVGGFFSKMWGGAKSLGSKAIGKVKSVGSSAMKLGSKALGKVSSVGKAAISGVKNVASKLNPVKVFKSALGKIPVGKLLAKVVKLPIIGSVISGVLAASEVKDILNDPSKSEKDKRKEVGKVVGKSIAGIMGGAIAAGAVQILNAFPGLGVAAAPLAYLGGDFLGSSIAGFIMNNVSGIDEKIGDITGKVFKLDFKSGSKADKKSPASAKKAETESKKITADAKSSTDGSKKTDVKVDPPKPPADTGNAKQASDKPLPDTPSNTGFDTPNLAGNEPIDKQQLLEQNPQIKSDDSSDEEYKSEPTSEPVNNVNSTAKETTETEPGTVPTGSSIAIPANNTTITPEEASKTNVPVSQGIPLSKNQPDNTKPSNIINNIATDTPTTDVASDVDTLTADQPVRSSDNKVQQTSITSINENIPKQIGTAVAEAVNKTTSESEVNETASTEALKLGSSPAQLTSPPKDSVSPLAPKKKDSLLDRLKAKGGTIGGSINKTGKTAAVAGAAGMAAGGGLLSKGLGKLKSGGGKIKDKIYKKIDSKTPWYVPKASTMVNMSKSKLGRKGLALAGGYALNKAKGKIGSAASTALKAGGGMIKKAVPKSSGGILSKIGNFISSPGKSLKGAMSSLTGGIRNLVPFSRLKSKPTKTSKIGEPQESSTLKPKSGTSVLSTGPGESKAPGTTFDDRVKNVKMDYSSVDALMGTGDTPETDLASTSQPSQSKPLGSAPGTVSKSTNGKAVSKPNGSLMSKAKLTGKSLLGKASKLAGNVTDKGKMFASQVGDIGAGLLSKAKPAGKSLLGKASKLAGNVADKGKMFASQVGDIGAGLLSKVKPAGKSLLGKAASTGKSFADKVKNVKMDYSSVDALMGMGSKIKTGGKSLLGSAGESASRGASKAKNVLKAVPSKLKSKLVGQSNVQPKLPGQQSEKPDKGILSRLKNTSSNIGSSVLSTATKAKEKARDISSTAKEKWKEGTTPRGKEPPKSPDIMSSNSTSSSSNTTIINRFDTDTISQWRSKYVDDQHKPGHYSMNS